MTEPGPSSNRLLDRRVLVVSGKGGAGKTSVAAACAMAASRSNRSVLLVEVEGRDGVAGLLGIEPPGFQERDTPFGFRVLSITPREALLEYLWLFFHMRTLARTLRSARVLEVATEAIPGFRDLMSAGKLYELTEWRDGGRDRRRPPYDLVVVDAPPTGQLVPFMRGPSAFRDLIRVGRPHRQLASIERLLRERSRLVLVATPDEMAVEETMETATQLAAEGLPLTAVVANRVRPSPFPRGTRAPALRLTPARVAELVSAGGPAPDHDAAGGALVAALAEDARSRVERRHLLRLREAGPVIELPFLYTPTFGAPEVQRLADALAGGPGGSTPASEPSGSRVRHSPGGSGSPKARR
jgi:anion-transporting  ArsA/GET3 family ATPase